MARTVSRTRNPKGRATALTVLAALALALVVGSGCSADMETPKDQLEPGRTLVLSGVDGTATGRVSVEGRALAAAGSVFLVEITPAQAILTDASALMPSHGHGSPTPASITQLTDAYRVSGLVFSMPGLWNVFLDVDIAGRQDRMEFSVDVP